MLSGKILTGHQGSSTLTVRCRVTFFFCGAGGGSGFSGILIIWDAGVQGEPAVAETSCGGEGESLFQMLWPKLAQQCRTRLTVRLPLELGVTTTSLASSSDEDWAAAYNDKGMSKPLVHDSGGRTLPGLAVLLHLASTYHN